METNPNPSKETPKRYIACWACHVSVGIPKFEKDWLTQFKCGWCGAITDLKPTTQRHGLLLSSSRKTDSRWKCLVLSSEILVTGFVVTLLSMITGVGYWVILPQAYNDIGYLFWNRGLTLFFAINIFVNYFMASWKRSNAEKRDLPNTKTSTLPKGIYDNYRYCVSCQNVKLPSVHHCRACNACIEEMDHHCPFIGNCVGRRNIHPFLSFLFWTAIGSSYAILTCSLAITKGWGKLIETRKLQRLSFWSSLTSKRHLLPWWTLASFYMIVVCFAGGIGVLILLCSQIAGIRKGQTMIDALQSEKTNSKAENTFTRLSHTFGGRNPFLWPFPILRSASFETLDCKLR